MACPSLLEVLVSVAQLPDSGPDIYASEGPLIQQPVGEDAFGGSILGQAVSAVNSTVPSGFDIYSAQSSFLRPIKANQAVAYHVDRIADGRTSCTRIVRATQGGGPCRICGPQARRGRAHPADLPRQGFEQIGFQIGQEDKLARLGVRAEEPFDWRLLPLQPERDPSQPRACGFVRASATTPLTHSAAVSMASLALLSDQSLFELSLFANWDSAPDSWRRLAMTISLNSRISFHVSTAKLDEWMVCDSGISWGANGRLSTNQRFWSHETGELLMTCSQDAVISRQESAL
ncbi:thioesterase-like superfamily-domain-containing protein [Apiospora arundinis]